MAKASEKRKNQANKIVQKPKGKAPLESELKDQYFIIRQDLVQLKDDLTKGYEMARQWFDKKDQLRGILKAK